MSARISLMGAQLITFCKSGRNLLWCRDEKIWGESAPLLFPICGRLRENKYTHEGTEYTLCAHGFAKDCLFVLREHTDARAVLELTNSEKTMAIYPFPFLLRAIYELTEKGLEFAFEVENPGDCPLYFSCGGHWSFALEMPLGEYSLHFDSPVALQREILDGAYLSGQQELLKQTQRLPLGYHICDNDTYVFRDAPAACTLMLGDRPLVRLEYPDTPHLLLWTLPGQKYICIEPWNGLPDGKQGGALKDKDSIECLSGGECRHFRHRILPL